MTFATFIKTYEIPAKYRDIKYLRAICKLSGIKKENGEYTMTKEQAEQLNNFLNEPLS